MNNQALLQMVAALLVIVADLVIEKIEEAQEKGAGEMKESLATLTAMLLVIWGRYVDHTHLARGHHGMDSLCRSDPVVFAQCDLCLIAHKK